MGGGARQYSPESIDDGSAPTPANQASDSSNQLRVVHQMDTTSHYSCEKYKAKLEDARGIRRSRLKACLDYTISRSGHLMYQLVIYPFQTSPYHFTNPREVESLLVWDLNQEHSIGSADDSSHLFRKRATSHISRTRGAFHKALSTADLYVLSSIACVAHQ